MREQKTGLIALSVLAVLAVLFLAVYQFNRETPVPGEKTIDVLVTHSDGMEKDFTIVTESENLRGALEPEGLIDGTESDFGLFVETVDGETADMGSQEWWMFSQEGESLPTGVDDTMIADGDHYEITFTVGW